MTDRILGALYGHLCGDALGVPYEFQAARDLPANITWRGYGSHHQPPGTWSDDGALMLCLVASLMASGGFDAEDFGRRCVAWRDNGYQAAGGVVFDIGGTTQAAIARARSGVPAVEAGPRAETDNGNGSLMRILPLALWYWRAEPATQVRLAHDCSAVTHGHPVSQAACALHNLLAVRLLRGASPTAARAAATAELRALYAAPEWGEPYLRALERLQAHPPPSGGGYVVDCLASALAALEGASDYAAAVIAAVRFGHDTDTTAAVAGGLAGLTWRLHSVPADWRSALRLNSDQRQLLQRFAQHAAGPDGESVA